jgi:S1-C subfamily serine protease
VIRIDGGSGFTPAVLGDSDAVQVGDVVLAIGSPFELSHSVTQGIISAVSRKLSGNVYEDYLQTDAAINPGNSGGALVNLRGEVIGINTRILNNSEGIGFAIPMRLARGVMERIIRTGKVDRGFLGVTVVAIDETLVRRRGGTDLRTLAELLADLRLEKAEGAFVDEVRAGSPADKAGLRIGDVITAIAEKRVATPDDLVFTVADTPPGTRVKLSFLRDGRPMEREVVLTARPSHPSE